MAERRRLAPDGVPDDAPLAGVIILEESPARSVRFAGRLFASYGATVIRVEGGAGTGDADELNAAAEAFLDAGKLSVKFDIRSETGTALLAELESHADIVARFVDPGDTPARPAAPTGDGPVRIDLSWFGRTGPWSGFLCDDFLAQHASGMAFTSALRMEDTATDGPRAVPGHLAEMVAGLAAATAGMIALTGRESGTAADSIDISVAESIVSFMRYETVIYSYGWGLPSRSKLARSPVAAPVFQQATADGFVDMLIMQEAPWRALLEILGSPSWGNDEIFATHPSRSEFWDALEPLLQSELRKRSTAEVYEAGQRRGIAIAPVNTIAQAASAVQFRERDYFIELPIEERSTPAPGRPFRLGDPFDPQRAPRAGENNRRVFVDWLGRSPEELRNAGVAL